MSKIVVLQTPMREYLAEETPEGVLRALVRNSAEKSSQWKRLPDADKTISKVKKVFNINEKQPNKEHLTEWGKHFNV